MQLQVARPAFETWFRDTDGVAHNDGEFVVGTANAFIAEMLEHRMYPLIERAIEHVIGEPTAVRFQVITAPLTPEDGQSDLPSAGCRGERAVRGARHSIRVDSGVWET